jgi:hypothetical protein
MKLLGDWPPFTELLRLPPDARWILAVTAAGNLLRSEICLLQPFLDQWKPPAHGMGLCSQRSPHPPTSSRSSASHQGRRPRRERPQQEIR